jgi:hypothetical protein
MVRLSAGGSLFRYLTLKFWLHATETCHVPSNMYENGLLYCRNQLGLAFGRAAACLRYVLGVDGSIFRYLTLKFCLISAACD